MALHHSRQPVIKVPTSNVFQAQVRQPVPFSEQPPNKRPRLEEPPPKRVFPRMTPKSIATWSETNLQILLSINDEVTIDNLKAELDNEGFEWHINEDLNVPLCKDGEDCRTCERYHKHVMLRGARADDEESGSEEAAFQRGEGTAYADELKDSEDEDELMDSEAEGGSREIEFKSESMKKLLRLWDLLARRDAFKGDTFDGDTDQRAMGQMEGIMSGLQAGKLLADADRDHANARWSVAQAELDILKQTHYTLIESQKELRAQTDSQISRANTAQAVLEAELAQWKQSFQDLKQAHEDLETRHQLALGEISTLKQVTEWQVMHTKPMPSKDDPPHEFARWMQFHELTNIPGVPTSAERNWVVDCRDIRGYHQVMCRVPPKTPNQSQAARKHRSACLFAILNVLAIPREYTRLLSSTDALVATVAQLTPLPLAVGKETTKEQTTHMLASQGLTARIADDTWQFCFNYLVAKAKESSDAADLLAHVQEALRTTTKPAGLHPHSEDLCERGDLPDKRRVRAGGSGCAGRI